MVAVRTSEQKILVSNACHESGLTYQQVKVKIRAILEILIIPSANLNVQQAL